MDKEKITGTILKFDVKDFNGKIFPRECEITYADKVPIMKGFEYYDTPKDVVGNASIIRKDDELIIEGEIYDNILDREPYLTHMGFFANKVKTDDNKVTKMNIRSVILLSKYDCAIPGCEIKREDQNEEI